MVSKKCEVCGIEIGITRKKFCSRKCIRKSWKIRNRDKVNDWQRIWFRKERNKRILSIPDRTCPECHIVFSPSSDRMHTYKTYCSTQCRLKNNSRRQTKRRNEILKNPSLDPIAYQKFLARRKVQDANYKAIKRGCKKDDENHISLKSWLEIKENHGNRCVDCGKLETETMKLSIDHVYPISKGGKNSKNNIQPRCRSCNSKKSARIISIPHTSR